MSTVFRCGFILLKFNSVSHVTLHTCVLIDLCLFMCFLLLVNFTEAIAERST